MNLTTLGTSYNWNHTILVSFCDRLILLGGFPGSSAVKNPPANAGDMGLIPGSGRPLKQEMATCFCIWGRKRVRHDSVTKQQHPSQKTKIMASGHITSWEIDGETVEIVSDFIFLAPKSLQMVIVAMKLKDACSLE